MARALPDRSLITGLSRTILSVSELNEIIKGTLESHIDPVWVVGEISNLRVPPSGHFYFTLKDEKNQIGAVLFRRQGANLRFMPQNGLEVICFGHVGLYSVRGDLQFYVDDMEPKGQGALSLAFEQLKQKLAQEGLFAQERKRELPFLPASIGIVTSDKGAALYDMLRVIGDRFAERRIVVRPAKVQGEGAVDDIATGIAELGRFGEIDVMIVGRGGGSLEDLWAFNEEKVARAIFNSPVPVISAVGHEIDFTIADFVADHRAPTPTAAAEVVVPRRSELAARISELEQSLLRGLEFRLQTAKEAWKNLVRRLGDPQKQLREHQQRVDELSVELMRRLQDHIRRLRDRLGQETGRLNALSPLAVLDRGYSIAHRLPEQTLVKSSETIAIGDRLRVTFARGRSICRVEEKE